jgi:hypothetical protein
VAHGDHEGSVGAPRFQIMENSKVSRLESNEYRRERERAQMSCDSNVAQVAGEYGDRLPWRNRPISSGCVSGIYRHAPANARTASLGVEKISVMTVTRRVA